MALLTKVSQSAAVTNAKQIWVFNNRLNCPRLSQPYINWQHVPHTWSSSRKTPVTEIVIWTSDDARRCVGWSQSAHADVAGKQWGRNNRAPRLLSFTVYPNDFVGICSYPYTYNGGLYYSCIDSMSISTAEQPYACLGVNSSELTCTSHGLYWRKLM